MRNRDRLSYKLIIIFAILIVVVIATSMVMMSILMSKVRTNYSDQDVSYSRHYAFIHSDDNTEFWNDVYDGALEKGRELGVYVENFGENLTVDYDTNELIRIAVEASVDGIIVESEPDTETAAIINEAAAAGIPVVTLMNDCSESKRVSYVGISSYTMGRQYGERIVKHVADGSREQMTVDVIMNSGSEESGSALVVSGIQDVFNELGYDNCLSIEAVYIDSDTAFSAEESIRDIFLQDDLPDAIVGLNAVHTRCLFQAAVDYNRVGDVLIYGFDTSDDILDAVSKDIVEATLSVDTAEMGRSCVEALEEYLNTGYVSDYWSMDTNLIMEQQADLMLSEDEEAE